MKGLGFKPCKDARDWSQDEKGTVKRRGTTGVMCHISVPVHVSCSAAHEQQTRCVQETNTFTITTNYFLHVVYHMHTYISIELIILLFLFIIHWKIRDNQKNIGLQQMSSVKHVP